MFYEVFILFTVPDSKADIYIFAVLVPTKLFYRISKYFEGDIYTVSNHYLFAFYFTESCPGSNSDIKKKKKE